MGVGAERLLVTDTTFRDAHQSLLATWVRTYDLMGTAGAVARRLPNLFSLEMWGGATFDAALRFLYEDPWERLRLLREAIPNICFQMLLRASNAVGYTSYPDNVVREFVIEALRGTHAVCEVAICYRANSSIRASQVQPPLLRESGPTAQGHGCSHSLHQGHGGAVPSLCRRPVGEGAAEELGMPIHFHTHDASGVQAATLIKGGEAGIDIIDAAVAAVSGSTSQPNLNTIVGSLKGTERDTALDSEALGDCSLYWETVRTYYQPFDNSPRPWASASAGGRSRRGRRCQPVAGRYREGHPIEQAVGDLALFLLSKGMTCDEVRRLPPDHNIGFPESVVDMMRGSLGEPPVGGRRTSGGDRCVETSQSRDGRAPSSRAPTSRPPRRCAGGKRSGPMASATCSIP